MKTSKIKDQINDARDCSHNMQHCCGGPILNLCLIPSVERQFIQTPDKMARGGGTGLQSLETAEICAKRQFH